MTPATDYCTALLASYHTARHAVAWAEMILDAEVWAELRALAAEQGPARVLPVLTATVDAEIESGDSMPVATLRRVRSEMDGAAFREYVGAKLGMV